MDPKAIEFNHKAFEFNYKSFVEFDKFFGLNLEVHEPGKITYRLEVKKDHATKPDQAHGGVIAAMMDAVLGVAALTWSAARGALCSTVEFKLNYLSPARPGETLVGNAQIEHGGSTIIVVSGDIREAKSERIVAKGLGTFSQYRQQPK